MENPDWRDLAPHVTRLVDERFPTRSEFARHLGEIPGTVNLWLAGHREPKVGVLIRMADVLKLSLDALLGRAISAALLPKSKKESLKSRVEELSAELEILRKAVFGAGRKPGRVRKLAPVTDAALRRATGGR